MATAVGRRAGRAGRGVSGPPAVVSPESRRLHRGGRGVSPRRRPPGCIRWLAGQASRAGLGVRVRSAASRGVDSRTGQAARGPPGPPDRSRGRGVTARPTCCGRRWGQKQPIEATEASRHGALAEACANQGVRSAGEARPGRAGRGVWVRQARARGRGSRPGRAHWVGQGRRAGRQGGVFPVRLPRPALGAVGPAGAAEAPGQGAPPVRRSAGGAGPVGGVFQPLAQSAVRAVGPVGAAEAPGQGASPGCVRSAGADRPRPAVGAGGPVGAAEASRQGAPRQGAPHQAAAGSGRVARLVPPQRAVRAAGPAVRPGHPPPASGPPPRRPLRGGNGRFGPGPPKWSARAPGPSGRRVRTRGRRGPSLPPERGGVQARAVPPWCGDGGRGGRPAPGSGRGPGQSSVSTSSASMIR